MHRSLNSSDRLENWFSRNDSYRFIDQNSRVRNLTEERVRVLLERNLEAFIERSRNQLNSYIDMFDYFVPSHIYDYNYYGNSILNEIGRIIDNLKNIRLVIRPLSSNTDYYVETREELYELSIEYRRVRLMYREKREIIRRRLEMFQNYQNADNLFTDNRYRGE